MTNQLEVRGRQGHSSLFTPESRKPRTGQVYAGSVSALVDEFRPAMPVYILRPERVAENTRRFIRHFPGTVMYAVKCNPDKTVLQTMARAGLKAFDCASIEEIRMVRKAAPKAKIYFMHPVKAREAIREAYEIHGVRAFVLDCVDELHKILQETDLAPDLELFVRFAIPKANPTLMDLAGKFGATTEEAIELLRRCRPVSVKLGVSFHVGTQCMKPERYAKAINLAASIVKASGVALDVIDVGGGFPTRYPGQEPVNLDVYMDAIRHTLRRNRMEKLDVLCEPGRALVADAGSVVVRVEQRKGDLLYLNDGTYGSLMDAGPLVNLVFPARLIRPDNAVFNETTPFRFAGPTCDSIDMMKGPFVLPADAAEGDWIEIGQLGAYCLSMHTRFNGFGKTSFVILKDESTVDNVVKL